MCNPLVTLPVWFDGKQLVMGDVGRLAEHASLFNCRVASPEQLGSQEGSAWQPRTLLCDYRLGCESVLPRRLKGETGVMVWQRFIRWLAVWCPVMDSLVCAMQAKKVL